MSWTFSTVCSDKDIAYQGTLAIAFGARGSGNAAAHYEPLRKAINLTKLNGAGSLAHEWWHGFDDYLGQKMGAKNFLSEEAWRYPLFEKLLETMKYKPQTPEQAAQRHEQYVGRIRKNAEGLVGLCGAEFHPQERHWAGPGKIRGFESGLFGGGARFSR